MDKNKTYWFPAKRYGWGWGFPCCWQGWLVTALFALLLILIHVFFHPAEDKEIYISSMTVLTVLLIAICWWKGEPPRWRWGGD